MNFSVQANGEGEREEVGREGMVGGKKGREGGRE